MWNFIKITTVIAQALAGRSRQSRLRKFPLIMKFCNLIILKYNFA